MANKKLKLLYLARFCRRRRTSSHPKTFRICCLTWQPMASPPSAKASMTTWSCWSCTAWMSSPSAGKTYGYFLGQREFQLPELKLLIDVVQASPFLTQSKSMELIAKLEQLTSRPNARQLRRQVYVMDRVRTHNEKLYYAIDGPNTAINDDRKVTFRYFDWQPDGSKAYRRDGALYRVDPVALCVDRHYYLVAYDPAIQDYRHYRLDRREGLTVTDTPRDPCRRALTWAATSRPFSMAYRVFRAPARVTFGHSPKSDQKVCLKPKVSRLPARYALWFSAVSTTRSQRFIFVARKRTVSASAPLPLISATAEPAAPTFQSKSGSAPRSRDNAIFR